MASLGATRSLRIGLAVSAAELCAAWNDGARLRVFRSPMAAYPGDNGAWPGLAAALAELKQMAGAAGGGRLAVALLPPLVEMRRLELPPLGESEIGQLLSRNGGRYFVGARGPQVAGALVPRGRRESAGPVLAASASARLLSALHNAARGAGWQVASVTPAESAWAAAAVGLWPSFARRASQLLVHEQDRTALVELEAGRAANVRRFRPGDADADLVAAAIGEASVGGATSVGAFGVTGRDELRRALAARGITVNTATGAWAEHADSPEVMAAAFADRSGGPWLVTDAARAEQRARVSRAAVIVAAAAALFFVAAAGVELWGLKGDLAGVRAERAAIRSQVSATLVGRTSVEDAYRRIAALAAAQRDEPHWAPVLAQLSARIPRDAYLTAFHVRGDSLVLDGLATSAGRVFDAIEHSPGLADVRAAAPVRREVQEGSPAMERFTIAAERRDSAAASAHPGAAGGAAGTPGPRGGQR